MWIGSIVMMRDGSCLSSLCTCISCNVYYVTFLYFFYVNPCDMDLESEITNA